MNKKMKKTQLLKILKKYIKRHLKSPRKDAYRNFCVSFWRNFQAKKEKKRRNFQAKKEKKRRNFRENFFNATLTRKRYLIYTLDALVIVLLPYIEKEKAFYCSTIIDGVMTVSPMAVEKIKSMKLKGFTIKEIAKECKVSERTVGEKLKEPTKTELVQNQQHSTTEKHKGDLEEQLRILELRPKVERELNEMMLTIEDEDEDVLMEQLEFLWDELENAIDLKEIKEIEELIAEGSDLSKKFNEVVDRWTEELAAEEAEEREETEEKRRKAEEKRKEYDLRYNWLKDKLIEVIEDVNGILPYPLSAEEIDDIKKETLPYGKPIYHLTEFGRFTRVLKNFGIPEDHAEIISKRWI